MESEKELKSQEKSWNLRKKERKVMEKSGNLKNRLSQRKSSAIP